MLLENLDTLGPTSWQHIQQITDAHRANARTVVPRLTAVIRCKNVANKLGQHHVTITADEQLFYKLMELKWANFTLLLNSWK